MTDVQWVRIVLGAGGVLFLVWDIRAIAQLFKTLANRSQSNINKLARFRMFRGISPGLSKLDFSGACNFNRRYTAKEAFLFSITWIFICTCVAAGCAAVIISIQ